MNNFQSSSNAKGRHKLLKVFPEGADARLPEVHCQEFQHGASSLDIDHEPCITEELFDSRTETTGKASRSCITGRQKWEDLKCIIQHRYLIRGLTLDETISYVKHNHNFIASKQQYVRKLEEWGFKKNRKDEDWLGISHALKRRRTDLDSADVYLNGMKLPSKRLRKEFSRRIRPTLKLLNSDNGESRVAMSPQSPNGLLVRRQNSSSILVSPPRSLPWFDFLDQLILVFDFWPEFPQVHALNTSYSVVGIGTQNMLRRIFRASVGKTDFALGENSRQFSTALARGLLPLIAERKPEDTESALNEMLTTNDVFRLSLIATNYLVYICSNNLSRNSDLKAWVTWLRNNNFGLLLDFIIDMQITSSQVFTDHLFSYAIYQRDYWLIQQVASKMSNVDARVCRWQGKHVSGLSWAVAKADLDLAIFLLSLGSDPNQCCCHTRDRLHRQGSCIQIMDLAASGPLTIRLVDYLFWWGAEFDTKNILFDVITNGGDLDLVQRLVDAGARTKIAASPAVGEYIWQRSVLIAAIRSHQIQMVEWLVNEKHCSPNAINDIDLTTFPAAEIAPWMTTLMLVNPLICSMIFWNGYYTLIDLLIQAGANVNECDCTYSGHGIKVSLADLDADPAANFERRHRRWFGSCYWQQVGGLELDLRSPLQVAAAINDRGMVIKLVEHAAVIEPCHGTPPLVLAVATQNYAMAEYLLRCGARPDSFDKHGSCITPLMLAVASDCIEMVSLLLSYSATLDFDTGETRGYRQLVQLYITQNRYELSPLASEGLLPLQHEERLCEGSCDESCKVSSIVTEDCYMSSPSLLEVSDYQSSPALQHLFQESLIHPGGKGILAICLKAGLYPMGTVSSGHVSMIVKALNHHCNFPCCHVNSRLQQYTKDVFFRLVRHGEIISLEEICHIMGHKFWTEFLTYIYNRFPEQLDRELEDHISYLKIHACLQMKACVLYRLIPAIVRLAKGRASAQGLSSELCLSLCALCLEATIIGYKSGLEDFDTISVIRALFEDGLSVNSLVATSTLPKSTVPAMFEVNRYAEASAIHVAPVHILLGEKGLWKRPEVAGLRLAILDFLITVGLDVDVTSTVDAKSGWTPLQLICDAHGSTEEASHLIEAGANVNEPGSSSYCEQFPGRTALQAACYHGNLDLIEFLIAQGADVNASAPTDNGGTALELAVGRGYFRIVQILVEAGAVLDHIREDGRTIFDIAAENGRLDCLKYLLDRGQGQVSVSGVCARAATYAEKEGHGIIARYLREYNS